MKVLMINGSPHQQGNTATALAEVAAQLAKNGIETETVWLGTQPVRGCAGCNTCRKTASGRCVFDDDMTNRIIEKMAECDALVLGSPVYYGQPAGQLLCLQQRLCYSGFAVLENKPAAVVCVCRRGGATSAFQTLNMPFQMVNMPIVTSQYWHIVYGRGRGEAAQDTEGLQTMRTMANNMAWMLKKIHGVPAEAPQREPWQMMSFIR